MKIEDGYLTDEELNQLILEVEKNELVSAAPGIMDEILTKIETQKTKQHLSVESKRKEFQRYCIRVITSVAAAVALVFLTSNMGDMKVSEVPSRQELVGTIVTREEVLNETGVINQIKNLLNKKIGGS